ncbi:MAG TPA: GNAT family N-acetyltransferase [Acidimicrobiales bacterium]|nr:GNAT family N-acetyltransferase [Acidimicrobiales bacterium]
MTATFRRPNADERVGFMRTFVDVMNQGVSDERLGEYQEHIELERSWLAEDAGRMVGTITGYSFELTLPGGSTVPMAGLSDAAVTPTHRRQGILTELMARFDADVAEREEPVIGLFASEAAIYGRYGFGPATRFMSVTVSRDRASGLDQLDIPGTVRWLRAADATDEIAEIFERTRRGRVGEIRRPRHMLDGLLRRAAKGDTPVFVAIHDGPQGPDGYAIYRVDSKWVDHTAQNEVRVAELTGDGLVRVALWRFLLSLDLVKAVTDLNARLDEPVQDLLDDPRQLRVTGLYDQLQLRVVDPVAALRARTYGADGRLRIGVGDCVYEMTVDGGKAEVQTTRAAAEVTLAPRALSMVYLGDRSFRSLAQAGLATIDAEAGSLADAMFSVSPAPQCLTLF